MNPKNYIAVTFGKNRITLHPYECVTGLFGGNVCHVILPHELTDNASNITLRTVIGSGQKLPRLEMHTADGVSHYDNVVSMAIEQGQAVWATADGTIHRPQACFAFNMRAKAFANMPYAADFLAFVKNAGGDYTFYTTNNINH